MTDLDTMTPAEKSSLVSQVRAAVAGGATVGRACLAIGVSEASFRRWDARFSEAGLDGLSDLPRSGRPGFAFSEAALDAVARVYLATNWRKKTGSLTTAARFAAKDPSSCLTADEREAILKPRASKHILPAALRRGVLDRVGGTVAARHRDPKAGTNDGMYAPGWLRMASDGSRRLAPGERQVWDDASVNVGVVVPWSRGGDACSDAFGVRVARFQLLACIDCATDFCVGYSFVMRQNDAYNNFDARSAIRRVWDLAGYVPAETVMEGGAWQAGATLELLRAAGTELISAKGRPNQKLVEGWFGRLWTILPVLLPDGQVGRFRGEMKDETSEWIQCREGKLDPRGRFPSLTDFLHGLDRAIDYLNREIAESREYGKWIPSEIYGAAAAKGHAIPAGLWRFALPVNERRTLRRGMVTVAAEAPTGWTHSYAFSSEEAWRFEGAEVVARFDPSRIRDGASLELAKPWQGHPAGEVIDSAAPCVSPAPLIERSADGLWTCSWIDSRDAARAEKKSCRAKVGAQSTAFDPRGGIRAKHAEDEGREGFAIRGADPSPSAADDDWREPDWSAREAAAGVMKVS